jgi:hypothetical protein
MTENPTPEGGRVTGLISAVKGLTFTNVLIIVILVIVAAPAYVVYKAANDPTMLDRFQSSFRELPSQGGCSLHEARMRGGTRLWLISTGFAYQGSEKWSAGVVLDHSPNEVEIVSYCESLKLITGAWEETP